MLTLSFVCLSSDKKKIIVTSSVHEQPDKYLRGHSDSPFLLNFYCQTIKQNKEDTVNTPDPFEPVLLGDAKEV